MMATPRQRAFKAEQPTDWKPTIGETVVRVIGCCDIRKQLILPIEDLRPRGERGDE
jgi:hypothetical protein